jgi:hypothetical protein
MKNSIIDHINNPGFLETAYRKDGAAFKQGFAEAYPIVKDELLAKAWYVRLNYKQSDISWGLKNEWKVVAILAAIVAVVAILPNFIIVEQDVFYAKNIGFIVFPTLMVYFVWKQQQPKKRLIAPLIISLISIVYINLLPVLANSDSVSQAFFHMPLFLWVIFGYIFIGGDLSSTGKKINFLRFNGDLLVLCGLMLIAGGIFTAITINLFEVLKVNIENIFLNYIMAAGLSIVPLFATYLIQNNGHLVHKVSPVIARIFTPLVTITLFIYLVTIFFTGTYPTANRDYLLLFNVLLIAVMALILFSLSEVTKHTQQKSNQVILWVLSVLAIIVNGIALGSILFRINDFGFTPNRLAVLGGDILILVNLLLVSFNLYKIVKGQIDVEKVESSMALFLPLYFVWSAFVVFGFPILFQYN